MTPSTSAADGRADPDAEGEQGEPGGIDAEDRAADQGEDDARRNGTRNQVGRIVARVTDRVGADAVLQRVVGAGERQAEDDEETGASAPPKVFQPTIDATRGVAALVARPVGGDVDPAEAETGHHQDEGADGGLERPD